MEVRNYIRPIIAGLVGLGVLVLIIVLFVKLLTGGKPQPTHQINLGKYADTSAVATLTIDAFTNIDQEHHVVKISVSNTQNEIDVINGYQGSIAKSQTYPNNPAAFGVFLQTMQLLNFSKGTSSNVDYRGFCPTGDRYTYTFNDGSTNLFSYWSTSCGGQGTFQGKAGAIRQQFERQIPAADFGKLTAGTSIIP
jgi:hypothetical protein